MPNRLKLVHAAARPWHEDFLEYDYSPLTREPRLEEDRFKLSTRTVTMSTIKIATPTMQDEQTDPFGRTAPAVAVHAEEICQVTANRHHCVRKAVIEKLSSFHTHVYPLCECEKIFSHDLYDAAEWKSVQLSKISRLGKVKVGTALQLRQYCTPKRSVRRGKVEANAAMQLQATAATETSVDEFPLRRCNL